MANIFQSMGKALFGSGPTKEMVYTPTSQVTNRYNAFTGAMGGQLENIYKRGMAGLGSFGPGFQGTAGILGQRAIAPYLSQLMGHAVQSATPTVIEHEGSAGLVPSILSTAAPLIGTALGGPTGSFLANLIFGGGGGVPGMPSSGQIARVGLNKTGYTSAFGL